MYRKYYTLRTGTLDNEEVYPEEFTTYEAAYDRMCKEYMLSCKYEPTRIKRYKIYQTTTDGVNSMTQPA